jgi:hypothetical protein
MRLLWWFIPEAWLPWIGAALLLGWVLGVVTGRTLLAAAVFLLLWPYVELWLGGLPTWVQAALTGLLLLAFLRDVLAFFLGDRAADHAVGEFVGWVLRLMFGCLLLPLRAARWVVRRSLSALQERMP